MNDASHWATLCDKFNALHDALVKPGPRLVAKGAGGYEAHWLDDDAVRINADPAARAMLSSMGFDLEFRAAL